MSNKKFVIMNTNEKVFELLEKTNLNWTVEKRQLQDVSGNTTGSYGMFRKNNNQWIGTVGEKYQELQNFELAEILIKATEGIDLEISRGGMLSDGAKIYMQASLPDSFIGKSKVRRWITTLNSHDGSTSVGFGSTNVTVVCQNTFHRSYGDLQKFRHTATLKERIAIAQKGLRRTLELDNELMENFKKMSELPLKDEIVDRVIGKLFGVTAANIAEVSTRKRNQVVDFGEAVKTSIHEQGDSVWALLNGITRYTSHVAAPEDQNKKRDYLFVNNGQRLSNVGYDEIMKWVTANTQPKTMVTV